MNFNIPCKSNPMPYYVGHIDYSTLPLTFKAVQGSPIIQLTKTNSPDPVYLSYSKNGGVTWSSYTVGDQIQLQLGQTVAFSGSQSTFSVYRNSKNNYYNFNTTEGYIDVYGNIMSLCNYASTTPNQNQF